jgi:TPR repeat protein
LISIFAYKFSFRRYTGEWITMAAEAGLPKSMFALGTCLDQGQGVAAPDYEGAVKWYTLAAAAGRD